ncbi:hypothetical protein PG985_001834 [Apiospora marii]|uniref:Uncharacterized protein n=1 Tax=Apiospora marii TaxID=335849 RepID=A0ABR1RZN8_9PEZI
MPNTEPQAPRARPFCASSNTWRRRALFVGLDMGLGCVVACIAPQAPPLGRQAVAELRPPALTASLVGSGRSVVITAPREAAGLDRTPMSVVHIVQRSANCVSD